MSGTTIDSGLSADSGLLARLSKPAEVNPLGALEAGNNAALGIFNTRNALAKQQAGEAFLNSIDPTTGRPDQAALLRNLKTAGPSVALAAQPSAQAGQTLSGEEQSQRYTRLAYAASGASQLLAQYPNGPPLAAVHAFLDNAGSHLSPEDRAALGQGFSDDPAQNRQIILQRLAGNISAQQALINQAGGVSMTNTGQEYVPTRTAGPGANTPYQVTPQPGAIPIVPSRESLNERVIVGYDANKNPIYGPKEVVTPPNLKGPLGTGRPPPALLNPANQPPAGGAQPPATPGAGAQPPAAQPPATTGMVTQPGPASIAAQTATGETSAKTFQDISNQGVQARSQTAILGNMLADVGQFTTGPGAEGIKRFQAVLQRVGGIVGASFGINADKVAANESFDKFAAQLANAQGATTDARLAVNQHANPNATMTPAGVDLILRQLQGNSDYLGARAALASKWGDKGDSAKFENDVGGNLDPRAFQYARMTGPQKTTYVAALSATDRKALEKSYNYAHEAGLL